MLFALVCAGVAIAYGIGLTCWLLKQPAGNERMQEIARAVQEGAAAYLRRQYSTIAVVAVVPFLILGFYNQLGWGTAIGFLIGAVLSAAAGFIGMNVAVRSNVRTAEAAKRRPIAGAQRRVPAGSVTGLLVVGLGLLGVAGYYWVLTGLARQQLRLGDRRPDRARLRRLAHLRLRAARRRHLHQGGRRRRRPRREDRGGHPGGRPAEPGRDRGQRRRQRRRLRRHGGRPLRDVCRHRGRRDAARDAFPTSELWLFPLAIGGISILASVIGTFFARIGRDGSIMNALYKAVLVATVLSAIGFIPVTMAFDDGKFDFWQLYVSALVGLAVTFLLVAITEYYTGTRWRPVKSISEASQTGHATNIIYGLAVGMQATALPGDRDRGGHRRLLLRGRPDLYGIGVAVMAQLSMTGLIVALDAYGPVTDNAGGIAEMADLDESVRAITDPLDAVGNTTKAVTKGYAIGSAGLAALDPLRRVRARSRRGGPHRSSSR